MQVMMMMILTVMIRVTIIMNSSSYREEPVAVILNILIRQRRNAKKISLLVSICVWFEGGEVVNGHQRVLYLHACHRNHYERSV